MQTIELLREFLLVTIGYQEKVAALFASLANDSRPGTRFDLAHDASINKDDRLALHFEKGFALGRTGKQVSQIIGCVSDLVVVFARRNFPINRDFEILFLGASQEDGQSLIFESSLSPPGEDEAGNAVGLGEVNVAL